MRGYFEALLKTINDSIRSLDMNKFEELVSDATSVLREGGKIIASGLGKNVPICEKFEGTMLSLGLNAKFLHTNTAVHGDLGAVHEGDLVILLSKSGETTESIYLLQQLKKRKGIRIWSITFNEHSTLAEQSDKALCISMDSEGDKWNIVPNNSTTLYLIVLQALAIEISNELGLTLEDFRVNHPGGHIGVQLNGKQ